MHNNIMQFNLRAREKAAEIFIFFLKLPGHRALQAVIDIVQKHEQVLCKISKFVLSLMTRTLRMEDAL